MNQRWLIDHVLSTRSELPDTPGNDRAYLTHHEAEGIVDAAIDELGIRGSETEYSYMLGHRTRLIHALTMIPKADEDHRSILDVGCYGYMGFWAAQHLGYERVVGIEWHPNIDDEVISRELSVAGNTVRFDSYNFDISNPDWRVDERFDTVLFFEVLEHINVDPMGVMEWINRLMNPGATLVMSVPNAISYKALREFLVGMPPWTYWFYHPDLSHEPRHCFEYTPTVFRSLLIASGMSIDAMRTIFAYSTPGNEKETLEIAESIGFDRTEMGETMIAHCTKTNEGVPLRYPDVLYSPEGYYKNIYPRLQNILHCRLSAFRERRRSEIHAADIEAKPDVQVDLPDSVQAAKERIAELLETCEAQFQHADQLQYELNMARADHQQRLSETESELISARNAETTATRDRDQHRELAGKLQQRNAELKTQVSQLLFQSDCRLQLEEELRSKGQEAERKAEVAQEEERKARKWAGKLQQRNAELKTQISQLLFQSDCRLQLEEELRSKKQEAEQKVEVAQEEERNTREWADRLHQENADLRAQVNELLFACDCYLQQVNDPQRCVRVIRERRFRRTLDRSKAIARKTPIVRTALRPVYRSAKRFIKRRM